MNIFFIKFNGKNSILCKKIIKSFGIRKLNESFIQNKIEGRWKELVALARLRFQKLREIDSLHRQNERKKSIFISG